MKNNSLDNLDKRDFILNYQILNNNIIINYTSGVKKTIPYTIDNEKLVLNDMKKQLLNSNNFKRKEEARLSEFYSKAMASSFILFSSSILLAYAPPKNPTFMEMVIACSAISTAIYLYQIINTNKELKEISDTQSFVEEKEKGRRTIHSDTPKVLVKNKLEK